MGVLVTIEFEGSAPVRRARKMSESDDQGGATLHSDSNINTFNKHYLIRLSGFRIFTLYHFEGIAPVDFADYWRSRFAALCNQKMFL